MIKLGVNVDHVATLRQARGGKEPSPLQAALQSQKGGADGITIHLREDRRHIQDHDLREIKRGISKPLNLEMALNDGIIKIALSLRPEKVCIVPERRKEVTTEGGLDVIGKKNKLKKVIRQMHRKNIIVSLFIDPDLRQVRASKEVDTDYIELHTGAYANACGKKTVKELSRLKKSAFLAHRLGIGVNAGHGLNYKNVRRILVLPYLEELNIGHSIISRSIFTGIKEAVREMKNIMKKYSPIAR